MTKLNQMIQIPRVQNDTSKSVMRGRPNVQHVFHSDYQKATIWRCRR